MRRRWRYVLTLNVGKQWVVEDLQRIAFAIGSDGPLMLLCEFGWMATFIWWVDGRIVADQIHRLTLPFPADRILEKWMTRILRFMYTWIYRWFKYTHMRSNYQASLSMEEELTDSIFAPTVFMMVTFDQGGHNVRNNFIVNLEAWSLKLQGPLDMYLYGCFLIK